MSFESYFFCKMCTKSDKKRDKGLKIPETVEYQRDIAYGEHKKYHLLDICWPHMTEGRVTDPVKDKFPVIVSVHGGGYVYGSKEVYRFYAASLAQMGFTVINFNYRLAPKFKYPAPLEDLRTVLEWMIKKSEKYPIDTDRVFLVGDSAGAQIVSQYGVICSNQEYAAIMGMKHPEVKIRGLGLCCGTYDLKKRIETEGIKGVIKDYLTSNPYQFDKQLDIFDAVTDSYPASYLFSSNGDFLKEECKPMADLLLSRGVLCEYKIYGNEQTGHVFHVDMRDEYGAQANREQVDFFRKILGMNNENVKSAE
ncbi:MAG: alpha/beta hydrolase fold domain-containing protein [Lachnospiraceae bacterium]|nr:alpha/beta hydrolase fold domain-containing protein [Lachnospiraceae bacterium]